MPCRTPANPGTVLCLFMVLFLAVLPATTFGSPVPSSLTLSLSTETKRLATKPEETELQKLLDQAQSTLDILESLPGSGVQLDTSLKRTRRGLRCVVDLVHELLNEPKAEDHALLQGSLLEIVAAVNNNQRSPVPKSIESLLLPFFFLGQLHLESRVGSGSAPAANLGGDMRLEPDSSRLDPVHSTFWRPPSSVASKDLYRGFDRTQLLKADTAVYEYLRPKSSYGLLPGFEVGLSGREFKVKFGEVHSEPFAARIFDALGFHVDPTDYVSGIRVRYDRRIFLQFNSRHELSTRFQIVGIWSGYTLKLQQQFDPFDYVRQAKLKDGNFWSGKELRTHLLRDPGSSHPEIESSNYRAEVEKRIDYLVLVPANFQAKRRQARSVGPWDFSQLNHADLRELRGVGLLAAWLGWFDTRFDNTLLRIRRTDHGLELIHYFSDLGGTLGETEGLLYSKGELPNAFPWTFTRPPLLQGSHRMALPLRLTGYKPLVPVPAFDAMTLEDARWMARLIGQLQESQIVQALVAAGFDSAQVRLYVEKLVARRDRMVQDLGLVGEIPLYRPTGANRHLQYDPRHAGPVLAQVEGLGTVSAPITETRVVDGKLVSPPRE